MSTITSNFQTIKTVKTRKATKIFKEEEDEEEIIYEQLKKSDFKQQRLPAWRPVPTLVSIIIVYSIFGIAFIIFGIILVIYSKDIKKIVKRYDDECQLNNQCNIIIKISNDMKAPIMIYYQLDGFFQNHRRYVQSKSMEQLHNKKISIKNLKDDCKPVVTNKEMSVSNEELQNDIAIPCGLIAKTYFNDDFVEWKVNDKNIDIDVKNIAYAKDIELINKEINPEKQWINITDEHFIVWMRPSGLPNPKKLWGRIRRDLNKNDVVNITIDNKFDVSGYGGKKKIILSTTNIFGGNLSFLGISFIVVGSISLILAIVFPIGNGIMQKRRKID